MKHGKTYKNRLLAILLIIAMVMTGVPVQNVYAAQKKTVTVTTQKALEKALKNKNVTQITIKTSKTTTFKIKKGNYTSKKLIVKAPKAKINNYAKMKSVSIKDAKKYMEYASNNNILVEDKSLTLGVEKEATVKHLNIKVKNANNKLVVKGNIDKLSVSAKKEKLTISNSGTIKRMNISQLADISIKGTSKETINVTTSASAKNTLIKSSVPVYILAKADINIQLNKGAESSTVILKNKANAVIKNKTKEVIMLETAKGEKLDISTGVTLNTEKLNSENVSSNSIPLTGIEVYVENGMNTTILMQEGNYYKALIEEGNKAIFGVRVTPANATNKEVIWTSSDTSIAMIDENGMVTGIKKGTVTITATSKENSNIKGTFLVNITNKYPDAIHIKIENGKNSVILEKSQLNLTVTTEPVTASNEVVWSSSNTNIAMVDENGVVTGVEKGTVTITATSKEDRNIKGTIIITVTSKKIEPTEITVNVKGGGTATVIEQSQLSLEAIVSPSNATNKGVEWSSSDNRIATVDGSGVVTGIKKGTVVITATSKENGTVKGECVVVVTAKEILPTAIEVNVKDGGNTTVKEGSTISLIANVTPSNATNKEIIWSSLNNSIATVDESGFVTAVSAGQVTIIATSTANGSVVGSITITIEVKEEIKEETKEEIKEETKEEQKEEVKEEITPTKITISVKEGGSKLGTDTLLEEGNTLTLEAMIMPEGASQAMMWHCFDTNVATIDENGFVTGIAEGEATIAAMSTKDSSVIAYFTLMVVGKSSSTDNEAGRFQLAKETAESIIRQQGIDTLGTDVEKIKAVHDYLVLNVAYDYSNYQNGTIPRTSYEAYGVIVLKTGVCDSYRKAFQLFMDILGIPCEGVSGTGNGGAHAWNIVTLDGERYHIDVTWDDPVPDTPGYVRYDYFLVDDTIMSQDHTWNYSSVQPCNGTKYKTYPYEAAGQLAQTKEEAYALIRKQYEEGTPEQFDIKILAKADVLASYYDINEYLWKELGVTGTLWHYDSIQVGDYYYHHVFKKVGE